MQFGKRLGVITITNITPTAQATGKNVRCVEISNPPHHTHTPPIVTQVAILVDMQDRLNTTIYISTMMTTTGRNVHFAARKQSQKHTHWNLLETMMEMLWSQVKNIGLDATSVKDW